MLKYKKSEIEKLIADLEAEYNDYESCLELSAQDAYKIAIDKLKELKTK